MSRNGDDKPVQIQLTDSWLDDNLWHRVTLAIKDDARIVRVLQCPSNKCSIRLQVELAVDGVGQAAKSNRGPVHTFVTPSLSTINIGGMLASDNNNNAQQLVSIFGVTVPSRPRALVHRSHCECACRFRWLSTSIRCQQ
jgi:hypothetical protein